MSLKRKRALERLRTLRAEVERDGLPQRPNLYHVAALTAGAIELLQGNDAQRAGAAARYVYRIAPRSFTASGIEPQLACRRGCDYCCHGYVSASAPQIFAAAAAIRRDGATAGTAPARVHALAERVRGVAWRARIAMREPCALLVDGACSIYATRPLACRGYVSLSVESCRRAFEQLTDEVLVPPAYANVRSALESALRAALKACGLPAVSYELTGALAKALADPDSEARWLNGEAVFDADTIDRSGDAAAELQREIMLDTLIAVARGDAPAALAGARPA